MTDDVYIEDRQLASLPVYKTCMEGDRNSIYDIIDGLVAKISKKND